MVTKKITLSLIVGALFSTLAPASADFLLARRLPTGKQILNISRFDLDREKDATTFSNTLVLKGFSPSGAGAILSLPYVSRETPAGHAEGLGDVSITTTQIFDPLKGLGIAPYLSVKFPTGEYDSKRKVNPGSGRFDTSLGTTASCNLQISITTILSVTNNNPTQGTITGIGINCGVDCTESYNSGTQVTLNATANSGSTFTGWSGCDSVLGNQCTVIMDSAKIVTAAFDLVPFDFSLSNGGAKSVEQGSSVDQTITATLISGATQSTLFSVSGLPSEVTGSFSPVSCNPTCSTTLSLTASQSASVGTFNVVTEASGSLSKTTSFTLTVNAVVPSTPTGLTATGTTTSSISLSWNAVSGATSYKVYRSTSLTGTYSQIASGLTSTTYTDSGLTPGITYYYKVTAVNSAGESGFSNIVSVSTLLNNIPPTVSIISPLNGATFNVSGSVVILASASDSDGTVSKVEFFNGTRKLGEDTSSPYSFDWSNVPAGSYSLTARATDNNGAITTSSAVSVIVVQQIICVTFPADLNEDFAISAIEANNYTIYWKKGLGWPIEPSTIPISYVTWVKKIYRSGEYHHCSSINSCLPAPNPTLTKPSECWLLGQ